MCGMSAAVPPLATPDEVLAIFQRDVAVHPYGVADVVQLADCSQWWVEGPAVVGVMDLPGSPLPVLYAVSTAPDDTLDFLQRLAPHLPPKFMATGPRRMAETLAADYEAAFATPYVKMHLRTPAALPAPGPDVVTVTRDDLDALERLFDTDPAAGDFFHPGLLDTGLYLGIWDGEVLASVAGIHVIDEAHGVAAIGNVATDPAHRRRGLARRVVTTLCHRLLERVATVGLNCRVQNVGAWRLYESLGFATILEYEEAELARR